MTIVNCRLHVGRCWLYLVYPEGGPIKTGVSGTAACAEKLEFNPHGLMSRRTASINDLPILEDERLFRWPPGRRPDNHPGLTDLGL